MIEKALSEVLKEHQIFLFQKKYHQVHLGMRVMTLIWCSRGWQVCQSIIHQH
jgi:hypothetical protein